MPVFVDGRRSPRPAWWVTLVLALVIALTGAVFAYGTQAYASEHEGRILPGVTVAGVDVGGMAGDEALAAVEDALAPTLDRPVTLRAGGRSWTTTARELGAVTDAGEVVAAAVEVSKRTTIGSMARMRWFGETLDMEEDVAVAHRERAVREFVDGVAQEVNVTPTDASVSLIGEDVQVTPEEAGQVLDTDAAVTGLMAALDGDAPPEVDAVVHPVPAGKTAADYSQVLVLRQSEHTLHLYRDGVRTHSWDVAVGESGHPTPTGIYEITKKRHMPTWVNPSPNGWGAGMPARIGPGSGNPLGVRALNWNAPAIRFHGTANVSSIGTNASKGCVRLTNDDVVELFDLVEVGATIISVG